MSFSDFCRSFAWLYVCRVFDKANWHEYVNR